MKTKHNLLRAIASVTLMTALWLPQAHAAAGDLDTTFSFDGVVERVEDGLGAAMDVAIQSNGKIVVVATKSYYVGNNDYINNFAILRYNSNGTPDFTFGNNGEVLLSSIYSSDIANAVAIQSDGKILVAGETKNTSSGAKSDFAVRRLNTNGTIDSTFGSWGTARTDFSNGYDIVNDIVIQPDGKIVAVGKADFSGDIKFALARYNTNGSLDTSFSSDGKRFITWGYGYNIAYGVALQTDGKIVVAGTAEVNPNLYKFALARFNTNGSLDNTFGSGGKVDTISFDGFDHNWSEARGITIQSDGKIIAAGRTNGFANTGWALARYNPNGTLDASFDGDGTVTTPFYNTIWDVAYAVAVHNGKIIAVGSAYEYTGGSLAYPRFAVARYTDNGALDTGFGGDGTVTFNPGYAEAYSFAFQSDGKIVAVGITDKGSPTQALAIVRFHS